MAREDINHLLVGQAVAGHIKGNVDEGRQAVLDDLVTNDRVGGQAAGMYLGSVSKVAGRSSVRVVNAEAFRLYVEKTYPDEIVTVKTVRPAFEKALLDSADRATLDGLVVDPRTGAVIPGATIVEGEPYLQVRPSDELKAAVGAKLNALVAGGLLELEAADD